MGSSGKRPGPDEQADAPLQGTGDVEPTSGLPRFVDDPRATQARPALGWPELLTHWDALEADLAERGVDLEDPVLMSSRSWRWLRVRILGLLTAPPASWREVPGEDPDTTRLEPVWRTRLQAALNDTRR